MTESQKLALCGGEKAVTELPGDLFAWPIVTPEDEAAVLEVLRRGAMSGNDVTLQFEAEMAAFHGVRHALGYCNGTSSILGGLWACGVGAGDEVIMPSRTYWASGMQAWTLGAGIVFADVDPFTLCIDPADIERRISERTRAIVVVHLSGYPCDMDAILAIARPRGIKVLEDVSHAQGGVYKGRMLGTIGDVGCMSLMSGKSLPAGEAGMLVTDDRAIWERATAFGFYERMGKSRFGQADVGISDPELLRFAGLPLGGYKHRMNQTCAAMGRVQLKEYPRRLAEIRQAMNYFWDCLEGVPGLIAHRVKPGLGCMMGGWYTPVGIYDAAQLGGLPRATFTEAVRAEGVPCGGDPYWPLHLHALFHEADVYHHGKPTAIAHAARDLRQGPGSLPVTEAAAGRIFAIPWFKRYRPEAIRRYADAFRKVALNADALLKRGRTQADGG
jgi:dTDP-4-amino-4,6-dideoxygalactose transaminase